MKPNNDDAFLNELKDADTPKTLARLVSEFRLSGQWQASAKLRKQIDKDLYSAVAKAYAFILRARESEQLNETVGILKKQDKSLRSNDPYLVVLHRFIDYGPEGKTYASRDKSVLLDMESSEVDPADGASHIEKSGGLVACAARYRKKRRGGNSAAKKRDRRKHTLASLRDDCLTEPGDLAVIVVRLVKNKINIARRFPLGSLPEKPERAAFYRALKDFFDDHSEG